MFSLVHKPKKQLKVKVLVTQLCPTLCNPTDCSPPGFSANGIFQARILQWIAISFPGDLPDPGIKPAPPALAGRFFTIVPSGKSLTKLSSTENCTVLLAGRG